VGSILGTHFVDVTDAQNPVEVDFESGAASGSFVIHRDYHNYRNYLYAVCDESQNSTLQIFDMSFLPDSVHKVYDSNNLFTNSHNIYVDTAMAKLYVCNARKQGTSLNGNLAVYSLANPTSPTYLGQIPRNAHDVFVQNDTAYLNDEGRGLIVYNTSNVANPTFLGSLANYPDKGYNHSGWLDDNGKNYYFADETHGMQMKATDVSIMTNINVTDLFGSTYSNTSIPHNLISMGDFLYVSHYYDGLRVYNTSDPSNITEAGFYDTYLGPNASGFKGAWGVYPFLPSGKVIVSDMQEGLYVFDVSAITGTTGINELDAANQVNVYPNPVTNQINLHFKDGSNVSYQFQLVDMNGSIIREGRTNANQNTIDLDATIQKGFYLLKLHNENETTHLKIVKSN
jgi:choice-of-anchor B domain-containing protein